MSTNQQNFSKDRKPEEQKQFEEADNAGRFASNDEDAKKAFDDFSKNANAANAQARHNDRSAGGNQLSDRDANRDPAQAHTYDGEAQNVNGEVVPPLNDDQANKAKNKATEGMRQKG